MKRWLGILSLLPMLTACGHPARNNSDGGQDGGGGHVLVSTSAEVREAIRLTMELATSSNFRFNPFYNFLSFQLLKSQFAKDPNVLGQTDYDNPTSYKIFDVVGGYGDFGCLVWGGLFRNCPASNYTQIPNSIFPLGFRNHTRELLGASPIVYLEDGDCGSPQDNHADASVSRFSKGATLCFSVGNLRRIPPNNLREHISSLILHELAHLNGYNEADAQLLQTTFLDFYGFRYAALDQTMVRQQITTALQRIEMLLKDEDFGKPNKNRILSAQASAAAVQMLTDMPSWADPVSMTLALQLKSPLRAYEFTVRIFEFLTAARKDGVWTGNYELPTQRPKTLLKPLQAIQQAWNAIKEDVPVNFCFFQKDLTGTTADPFSETVLDLANFEMLYSDQLVSGWHCADGSTRPLAKH